MSVFLRSVPFIALTAFAGTLAFGQASAPVRHSVVTCVKVKDGKQAEFQTYLNEVTSKFYKARVDSGEVATYIVARAVAPVGRSARCDYNLVAVYNGIPAELGAPGKLAADLKAAGLTITPAQMAARRDSLSYLVRRDTWRNQAMVGAGTQKGGYVRLNYYKVHTGMMGRWLNYETTGWQKLAEEINKQNAGHTWSVNTLVMPGGENQAYNAMTVDGFPSWEALMKGNPVPSLWRKVHPNLDLSSHGARINETSDRPYIDVLQVVDVIRK